MRYFGIDGCKLGWFFVQINSDHSYQIGVMTSIYEIIERARPDDIILLDIPIGLRDSGSEERLCDKEARRLLKPKRSSSVFPAPCRPSLYEDNYSAASQTNFEKTGRRLSQQSWAISAKIREVDEFMVKKGSSVRFREMHPEVCFRSLNDNSPLDFAKKKKPGFDERMTLLRSYYENSDSVVKQAMEKFLRKEVARDDILDALVGAITAMVPLMTVPDSPEYDERGLPMEIVYAECHLSPRSCPVRFRRR